jgi:hypothetical protein
MGVLGHGIRRLLIKQIMRDKKTGVEGLQVSELTRRWDASASGAGNPTKNPQAGVEQAYIAKTGFCQQSYLALGQQIVKAFALHPEGLFHHIGGRSVTSCEGCVNP